VNHPIEKKKSWRCIDQLGECHGGFFPLKFLLHFTHIHLKHIFRLIIRMQNHHAYHKDIVSIYFWIHKCYISFDLLQSALKMHASITLPSGMFSLRTIKVIRGGLFLIIALEWLLRGSFLVRLEGQDHANILSSLNYWVHHNLRRCQSGRLGS
jgi:hypothetical protein